MLFNRYTWNDEYICYNEIWYCLECFNRYTYIIQCINGWKSSIRAQYSCYDWLNSRYLHQPCHTTYKIHSIILFVIWEWAENTAYTGVGANMSRAGPREWDKLFNCGARLSLEFLNPIPPADTPYDDGEIRHVSWSGRNVGPTGYGTAWEQKNCKAC